MNLTEERVDELVSLVRKRFPGWQGFSDERFLKDETNYKRAAAAKAAELLGETALRKLVADQSFDEFIARLEKVGRFTNLLYQAVPTSGDLGVLYQKSLDRPAFCAAVLDLLYGEGPSHFRLDRFASYCKDNGLPNKWTFPTYFLFLLFPDRELFIKPSPARWFMDFAGAEVTFAATPASPFYAWVKSVAGQLLTSLAEYGAKDMIDIQSFIWVAASEGNVRYWKIQPGQHASMWRKWTEESFISIGEQGWDAVGDLSGATKQDFDSKWKALGLSRGDQARMIWDFRSISRGDRVIANDGFYKVMGIGTVTGPYYYVAGEPHGHRLPVEWDDTTTRQVNQGGWRKTLVELRRAQFEEIAAPPSAVHDAPPTETKPQDSVVSATGYFTARTFELLAGLHESPTKVYYNEHRADIATHVEQPLRLLFSDLAAEMPEPIRQHMEMEKHVTAHILKNDYGKGGTYDFIWGAFYPKGGKRISDAQLFMAVHPDRFEFGFYVGEYGKDQRDRFARNCRENRDALLVALKDRLPPLAMYGKRDEYHDPGVTDTPKGGGTSLADWLRAPGETGIHAASFLSADDVVAKPAVELRKLVADSFRQLFPFVLLTISDDPMPLIRDYLEIEEEVDVDLQPGYSLADCARDTSMPEVELRRWVRAIERKKQAIIYGPPGTGKTFVAEKLARHLVGGGAGFAELIQFHPAYAYEDFIQGIRPETRADGGLKYPLVPGRFLEFCGRAQTAKGRCVLIIDEINRANLARVFGELMYLLEYRDREIPLAGGRSLRIPDNVRLIGTMNTADRSIALVDYALRRRFAFLPLYPQYEVLERFHSGTGFPVQRLTDVLKELNARIGDRHYSVGITHFLRTDIAEQIEDIWRMEVEPYIEEYFFDQQDKADAFRWERIGERILKG
jgi:5-methylcytosine-specific restriction enzyme B